MNRNLSTTSELKDESGNKLADAITSRIYTWDGKPSTETDTLGNTTSYVYDAKGNQVKIIDALGNTTYKVYDRMGRNTALVSPKNYISGGAFTDMERTEYSYDELGRVVKQTDIYKKMTRNSSGGWEQEWVSIDTNTYEYDTLGNITKTTDSLGNSSITDYNLAGLVEYVTDAESSYKGLSYTVKYTYNGLGQKIKEAYDGAVYNYTYDGMGNVLRTEINNRIKAVATYDLLGRAISVTDGNGNTTHQKWNAFNKIAETITPEDATIPSNRTIYQYDKLGNVIRSQDSMGKVTSYAYDSFGRNLSMTVSDTLEADTITTYASYDLIGNLISQTDGNGNTTVMAYDAISRLKSQTNPLGQTTTYAYDSNGNKITETNYLGNSTQMLYDGINRLIEVRDAYNIIVQQLIYNDANAQESSYDALGNEIIFHYDRNLRQSGQTDGEGNRTYITYDYRGNINSKKDENDNTTSYAYDGENRMVSVTDAMGNRTMYSYDGNGNLISQTDGNGNTTTYTYNAANLLTARIDPKGNGSPDKTESYIYLANGLMATKTDRNGVLSSYTYDTFGRVLSEDAGGQVQTYSYDNNGNLLTMTDESGTTVRAYDGLNRNISKIVPGIGKSIYQYDLPGIKAGEYAERTTDPLGNVTLKTYDRAGRLLTVLAEDDNPTIYSYYPNGSRHKITYPDGTEQTYTYDRKNQVLSLANERGNGSIISSYSYTYDGAGNQRTKTEARGTTRYTYDSLNRLSTVIEPEGKNTGYTYDGAGNRSTETVKLGEGSVTTTYRYNPQNRLTATISTSGEETKYIYDNNGNLLTKASGVSLLKTIQEGEDKDTLPSYDLIIRKGNMAGTGSKDLSFYSYDNYNRLISQRAESTTSTYRYNAQGYRVEKSVNGETTKYLYEYDKVVLETDGDNNQTALNIYGTGLLYRETLNGTGTEGYYYLYNAHGDVTSLIDKTGNIAASYNYDAFGNILSETGIADNPIRYAGYQYDIESDLYYLNARYYDSKIARFITEDTYRGLMDDPLSLNLYAYCANNPIVYIDPSGFHWQKGDENLNHDAQFKIIGLTNAYYEATNQRVRDRIDKATNVIRNAPSSSAVRDPVKGTAKDTLVELPKLNDFLNAISEGINRGDIRKSEWQEGMKALGATVTNTVEVKKVGTVIAVIKNSNTIVDKAEMNVTVRDVRSTTNSSIRMIGLDEKLTTHYSAYYFYLPEWQHEMVYDTEKIASYYGIDIDDIGTADVDTTDEVIYNWNTMGYESEGTRIKTVVINTHSDGHNLLNDKSAYIHTASDMPKLDNKDIDKLLIYGCNAGHLDHTDDNPASQFVRKVNGGKVLASDGTVSMGPKYTSWDRRGFRNLRLTGSNRKPKGWFIYTEDSGSISISKSKGKSLNVTKMLKVLK